MNKMHLHRLGHHDPEICDGASCLVVFRRRPLPLRHRALAPTGGPRTALGRFATVLLAATVMLGALWLGDPAAASAADLSLSDLGARVCAPHGPECRERWNARAAAGDTFMTLVAATCLDLRYGVHELDGIVCLETVVHAARSLPARMLAGGTSESALNTRNGSRPPKPDQQWTDAVTSYFERIPSYRDQITPVIFDYFDCLLREMQTVKFALRHRHL